MSPAAFVLFTYPDCQPFLGETFRSLSQQTDQNFDVVIFNDGLDSIDQIAKNLLNKTPHIFPVSGAIPSIRSFGLSTLKSSNFKYIIFGDADDVFSSNRIKVSKQLLKNNDLVVNEVDFICSKGKSIKRGHFQNRLNNNSLITESDLFTHNFIGFTNSSMRREAMGNSHFPNDLFAIDWAFFSKTLLAGAKSIFTTDTTSEYRVRRGEITDFTSRQNNLASSQIPTKLQHYKFLSASQPEFRETFELFVKLEEKLEDSDYRNCYDAAMLKNMNPHPFWWEAAKPDHPEC